jgi:hypothetical protein
MYLSDRAQLSLSLQIIRFILNIRFGLLAQMFRRLVRNNKVRIHF